MKVYVFDSELRYIIEEFEAKNKGGVLSRKVGGLPLLGGGEEKTYEFDYSKSVVIGKARSAFYKSDGINYIQIGFKDTTSHGTLANYIQQWNYAKLIEDTQLKPPKDDLKTVGIILLLVQIGTVIVFAWISNNYLTRWQKINQELPAYQIGVSVNKTLTYITTKLNISNNMTQKLLRQNIAATQNMTLYLQHH